MHRGTARDPSSSPSRSSSSINVVLHSCVSGESGPCRRLSSILATDAKFGDLMHQREILISLPTDAVLVLYVYIVCVKRKEPPRLDKLY